MPLVLAVTAGSGLVVVAACLWILVRSVRDGNLGPNDAFGLRTKATERSRAAWWEGHRAAEPLLRVTARAAIVSRSSSVGSRTWTTSAFR